MNSLRIIGLAVLCGFTALLSAPANAMTASPSPSPSPSPTAAPAEPAPTGATGSPSDSPSPSSHPSASPAPTITPQYNDCAQGAPLRPLQTTITAGESVTVTAFTRAGTRVDLMAADRQVGTRQIRSAVAEEDGELRWAVRSTVNTVLQARQSPEPCTSPVFGEPTSRISVRSALTLMAARNSTRNYTFSGRALPARSGQVVYLSYRTAEGRNVLAATAAANAAGTWRIDRRFSGSGRFELTARTATDELKGSGSSGARPTIIH